MMIMGGRVGSIFLESFELRASLPVTEKNDDEIAEIEQNTFFERALA